MARPRLIVALPLLAGFLGGCAVDQKKEVATYQNVLRANLLSSDPAFTPGQPLTLRQALDLTNRQNERLAVEGENYLQALIDRQRAAAAFLPTVTLVPTYSFREKANTGSTGNSSSAQTTTLDVPARAEANLFSGFSDVARLRRDARTIEQRKNLLLDLQEQVLLETARVYYDILRAERSADVLVSSLKVQDARVRDIVGRQRAGFARPLDVAQIEAQASATRVALINAQNDVRNGRTTLVYLTAAPVGDSPLVDQFDAPASLPTLEQMQATALEWRRDLQAARAATQAARQQVEVAWGQYYPSVSISTDLFLYRESFPDERKWQGLLSANLPLFSAGLINADVRQAWSQYRQAGMTESALDRQVRQDVQIALQNLTSAEQRIAELGTQLRAAQQALNQADQSYNVGLATNLERVAAQDQLLSAQLQLTSARFDRTLSYLELARSTGRLRWRLENTPSTAPTSAPAPTTTSP
jgi:outer membrane protein